MENGMSRLILLFFFRILTFFRVYIYLPDHFLLAAVWKTLVLSSLILFVQLLLATSMVPVEIIIFQVNVYPKKSQNSKKK
jgi:hypothetical protein